MKKLTREDIEKYGTEEEKKILAESNQTDALTKGIEKLHEVGADFYGAEEQVWKVLQEIWNSGYNSGYYRGTHNPDWGYPEEEEEE